ncbi:MscS family protein [Seminavis robusta]|uniref:MscS family protein n=1 Tax=Seminavis robusta TaxID=568900 RepID=A0A9N8DBR7_9STRA|nr:MscS family protein [Seminavis robusta]|eukprot:Sro72_g039850.1 MscS family protein (424) ;mRNA; r:61422-62833
MMRLSTRSRRAAAVVSPVLLVLLLLFALPTCDAFVPTHLATPKLILPQDNGLVVLPRTTATPPSSTALSVSSRKVQLAMQSNNFLRGKILLILSKFLVAPVTYYQVIKQLLVNTYWPEVFLIGATVNAMPMAQWYFIRQQRRNEKRQQEEESDGPMIADSTVVTLEEEDDEEAKEQQLLQWKQSFTATKLHKLAVVLQQFGILQCTLYISDVTLLFLKLMKFTFVQQYQAQKVAGAIIFSFWLANNVSRLKFYYLKNGVPSWSIASIRNQQRRDRQRRVNGTGKGSMKAYNRFANRILDVLIYMCAFLTVVDMLGIQIGFALKSIFGLGSFGTLVLSLASKDVAAEFVGGLMIQSSNFFDEGEIVSLQDGTTGTVLKIGWLHTYIQKENDNYVVRVPNSQISHQRIARQKRTTIGGRNNKRYL